MTKIASYGWAVQVQRSKKRLEKAWDIDIFSMLNQDTLGKFAITPKPIIPHWRAVCHNWDLANWPWVNFSDDTLMCVKRNKIKLWWAAEKQDCWYRMTLSLITYFHMSEQFIHTQTHTASAERRDQDLNEREAQSILWMSCQVETKIPPYYGFPFLGLSLKMTNIMVI